MRKLGEGFSIARIGDGEIKLMAGASATREPPNSKLRAELVELVTNSYPSCLIGILTMNPSIVKHEGLSRYGPRLWPHLDLSRVYASAHISRADHCPWICCEEYAELAHKIWRGKRAVVVAEAESEPTYQMVKLTAREVEHVPCPHRETYALLDRIEGSAVKLGPDVVVIAAGPAATCLAYRLARRGIQAVDVGRLGKTVVRYSSGGGNAA